MKRIFKLLLLILPFTMNGENYFTEGMEWTSDLYDTSTPDLYWGTQTVYGKQLTSEGKTVLGLYMYHNQNKDESTLIAYVRNEDNKVSFCRPGSSEWYLMYDWGLKVGDTCVVYNPLTDDSTQSSTLRCTEIKESQGVGNWKLMTMEVIGEDNSNPTGIWICGLSSAMGILYNNTFGLDGSGAVLKEVKKDGLVIYTNETAETIRIDEQNGLDSDSRTYDLTGRKVDSPQPGNIYIHNGQKILIK